MPGRLRRVLAPNPSPMTGPGTWTDIIGSGQVAVLDPGPDLDSHLAAILAALEPAETVLAILVTHAHLDHSALAPRLAAATDAPILAYGTAPQGRSTQMQQLVRAGLSSGGESIDHGFAPDRRLTEAEVITGPDWSLTTLHTPGHMGGHLAFAWGDTLFCGDLVMGWAPSLISPPDGDMAAYMASLHRLAALPWRMLLPSHGAPIRDPADRLAELIAHRRARETQILTALTAIPVDLTTLSARVYRDIPAALVPAARRNALAHLIDLASRNLVIAQPWPGPDAIWTRP
ncbi:MAG: MBL fold metallo-hydrolase [Paracoccaceae bacterium]